MDTSSTETTPPPDTGIPGAPFPIGVRANDDAAPSTRQGKTFRWWHDAIIDLLLLEPAITQGEISKRLKRGYATISLVMNSDLFKARYEQRRREFQQCVHEGIKDKLVKVANLGLELTLETLDKKRTSIEISDLVDITEGALDRLGYAPPKAGNASVQVNVNAPTMVAPVSREALESARATLRDYEKGKLIEGKVNSPLGEGAVHTSELVGQAPYMKPANGLDSL